MVMVKGVQMIHSWISAGIKSKSLQRDFIGTTISYTKA